ncbi:MAG: aromatic ring hydroxylase [Caldiserica bacterium]|nr:MAG: aromatic ring hydroxylase [Caldisericota bacterium]
MVTKEEILEALKEVYDPEIPVDIVNLGLVYDVKIEDGKVKILMTLTAVGCPVGPLIVDMVKLRLLKLEGVNEVEVELTFDPPWTPDKMSEEAKKKLGME